VCVRDNEHNAAKEMCGATFSQSCYGKRNERASCKIRSDGGNVEENT
jgi:hypothetical protein